MSINSLFGSARLSLHAQQIAMDTASHNIANASVEGYSRQRVDMVPNTPDLTPWGNIGTGVIVKDVTRVRDTLLDSTYRTQNAQSNGYQTKNDLLTQISNVFGEPSDTGLSSQLDQFWSSWSDLANAPTSTAAKSVVQQRGAQVASTLNRFSSSLDDIANTTRGQIQANVADINRYSSQIAALNVQIVTAESAGQQAPDLRDQRDNAVDALSKIVPVRTVESASGAMSVYINNDALVGDATARQLQVTNLTGPLTINIVGSSTNLTGPGGSLGASLDAVNTDIPAAKQQLDALAAQLVSKVNSLHEQGWSAAGDAAGGANWDPTLGPTGSNIDFFDPTKTSAATISLSADVASSAAYVAAGNVQNGTGNNAIAQQMSGLSSDMTTIPKYGAPGQTSFGEYYRDFVTRLGVDTNDASASATVYQTLAQNTDTQRQSVSGVSTDDELITLTQRQQAYAAAAKVITTASDMGQTLLDMVR